MADIFGAALRHVVTTLKAATPVTAVTSTRIYTGTVPEDATYPLILVQVYGDGTDITGTGSHRVQTEIDILVRVVCQSRDITAPLTGAAAVDTALHGTGPTTYTAGTVTSCVRVRPTQQTENVAGKTWQYAGGVYRLRVS